MALSPAALLRPNSLGQDRFPDSGPASGQEGGIEVIFRPDPNIYDGRYANVGWLQEIPKPLYQPVLGQRRVDELPTLGRAGPGRSQMSFRSSPTATRYWLRSSRFPAIPMMRSRFISDMDAATLDAWRRHGLQCLCHPHFAAPLFAAGAKLTKTGDTYRFGGHQEPLYRSPLAARSAAMVPDTHSLEGNEALRRGIIRYATVEEFKQNPNFAHEENIPEDPEPTETCSPTGATTRTPGAWPST